MKYIVIIMSAILLTSCSVIRSPSLQPFSDADYWVVREPMVYEIGSTGQTIEIPRGFVTDFASVPPALRPAFPKLGKYIFAAIAHDYLYWEQRCTKKQADDLFYYAMKEADVDFIDRVSFYAAVDIFGSTSIKENKSSKNNGYIKIIPENKIDFPPESTWTRYREQLKNEKIKEPSLKPNWNKICTAIDEYTT